MKWETRGHPCAVVRFSRFSVAVVPVHPENPVILSKCFIEPDAGGEGLEGGADGGAVGIRPVIDVVGEALGGFLVDGGNADFDEVGKGVRGEVRECVICCPAICGNLKASDVSGEEFLAGCADRGVLKKRIGGEVREGGVAAAEVAVEVERLVGRGPGPVKGQKVSDLTDIAFVRGFLGVDREGREKKDCARRVGVLDCGGWKPVKGVGIQKKLAVGGSEGVLKIARHDAEGGAGLAVGIDPVLVGPPELRAAVQHVQEKHEQDRRDRHGDEHLEKGEAGYRRLF